MFFILNFLFTHTDLKIFILNLNKNILRYFFIIKKNNLNLIITKLNLSLFSIDIFNYIYLF